MLVAEERDDCTIALAPFYCFESGIYFVGAGEAEYTDFIGDCRDPEVLTALILRPRRRGQSGRHEAGTSCPNHSHFAAAGRGGRAFGPG